jgi:integrase
VPKVAPEVSALHVRRLKDQGVYAMGGVSGLLMRVSDTGAKYFFLRARVGTQRRDIGIGPYPEISLAQAREKAAELKQQIRSGVDPVAQKQAARAALLANQIKTITFDKAARRFLAAKTQEFKNAKHAAQWGSTLDRYASPIIGSLPVDTVELAHIVRVLEPIWTTKTETANRVRGRIEKVLDYATVQGFRKGENPARWAGNLEAIFPKPGKVTKVKHLKALPWKELPEFLVELKKREGMGARALEFVILTAGRSGEVRGATWEEIDLEDRLWRIPAERMKAGKEHTVPLSESALELLKALPRMADSRYVFPAPRGGQLSDMTVSAVTKRMGVEAVPHGFRSTFRDWCAECTNYPHEVAEMALAHAIPSAVERAYRRGDLLEKRRQLMADWDRFCQRGENISDSAKVTAIGSKN